ncbi:MAG: DUF790 family protein [Polyangiaceae bacterium]
MLTPELAWVRRRGTELRCVTLTGPQRERALELGEALLLASEGAEGGRRGELQRTLDDVQGDARERKLVDGLRKLLLDGVDFEACSAEEAAELRRSVWEASAAARRGAQGFERSAVLAEVAASTGRTMEAIDEDLFADLRSEERVLSVRRPSPAALVERYELGTAQAVLLRATRVVAVVTGAGPDAYRALFRALKFRRLLHRIERVEAGYRIEIDGPFSLFDSVTRYGLALALALPALRQCGHLELSADVRWGKRREALTFRYEWTGDAPAPGVALSEDAQALYERLAPDKQGFVPRPCQDLLDLPGVGTIAPDLVLVNDKRGERVYLEILGYWSRDAVWKRIELARAGLGDEKIVFLVRERLRVSETLLDDTESAALYVYKNAPSASALMRKVRQVVRCEGL